MIKKFLQIVAITLLTSIVGFGQQFTPNVGLQTPAPGSSAWNIPLNYNFTRLDGLLSGQITLPGLNVVVFTTWQTTVTYSSGNTVFYLGNLYTSKANSNTGNLPTNTTWWNTGASTTTSLPSVVINYDLTAQTAGVGPTTLLTTSSGGTTAAKFTTTCIVVPYSGSGSVAALVGYTDQHSNAQQAISGSAAGTSQQQVGMLMNAKANTAITVTTVISGSITYDIHCTGTQTVL